MNKIISYLARAKIQIFGSAKAKIITWEKALSAHLWGCGATSFDPIAHYKGRMIELITQDTILGLW